MRKKEISSDDYQIFLINSLLWLILVAGGLLLTLVGFFYASFAWIAIGVVAFLFKKRAHDAGISLRISKELLIVITATVAVVTTFAFFTEASVFSGRDQGSFSEAAARLAQNHQLSFTTPSSNEFFKLHEPGRALNFPGFYYNNNGSLVTQFSLTYISWLALFFAIFGIKGFVIANAILLWIFSVSFYLLLRMFVKRFAASVMMILAGTSFVFMWFSKFTLSENIALPLLWMMIVSLMLFLRKQQALSYLIFLLSASLLCFARIEGAAFLITSSIVIFLHKDARHFVASKIKSRLIIPIIVLLLLVLANSFVDFYFYKEIIKALLPTVKTPQAQYLGIAKNNVLPNFYNIKIFYLYGMLGFFIVALYGIINNFWREKFHKLIPFFVVLPTFIYFFDSQITPDHPWMLRRFVFSLFPLAIFYSGMVLSRMLQPKKQITNESRTRSLGFLLAIALFAMNMPAFLKYATYSENKGLLSQAEKLSLKFQSNDLILIDQQASGDGWSMLTGPMSYLFKKNAVYFFNNQDLAKLDFSKFDNVYLVSAEKQSLLYKNSTIGEKLTLVDHYSLSTTRLDITKASKGESMYLPEKKNVTITGNIYKIAK
ncbi:MAG: hypothetical protein WCI36_04715 [bacterium]